MFLFLSALRSFFFSTFVLSLSLFDNIFFCSNFGSWILVVSDSLFIFRSNSLSLCLSMRVWSFFLVIFCQARVCLLQYIYKNILFCWVLFLCPHCFCNLSPFALCYVFMSLSWFCYLRISVSFFFSFVSVFVRFLCCHLFFYISIFFP